MAEDKEVKKREKIKIDYNQPFGAVLAQHMKMYRWSGSALAREVGCTRNHISELVSGKCHPSFILGLKITSVFGCNLVWRKIPAAPKGSRKKRSSVSGEESPLVESVEATPVSENGVSAKEKVKSLNELSGKVKTSKKAGEE